MCDLAALETDKTDGKRWKQMETDGNRWHKQQCRNTYRLLNDAIIK